MIRPRGILLDLDGTIADSIDFFYGLTCEVLTEAHVDIPPREDVVKAIAIGVVPHSRFLPEDFPDAEGFLRRVYLQRWEEWLRRYGSEVEPIPGACEAVAALHGRGLRVGLVTSSSGELPFLDRWRIRRFFSAIVNREDVERIKPDPEPLLAGLSRLDLAADEAISVGDTPLDVRAGRAAGIDTVGVLTGAGTEDQLRAEGVRVVLHSIVDLPRLLDETPRGAS